MPSQEGSEGKSCKLFVYIYLVHIFNRPMSVKKNKKVPHVRSLKKKAFFDQGPCCIGPMLVFVLVVARCTDFIILPNHFIVVFLSSQLQGQPVAIVPRTTLRP